MNDQAKEKHYKKKNNINNNSSTSKSFLPTNRNTHTHTHTKHQSIWLEEQKKKKITPSISSVIIELYLNGKKEQKVKHIIYTHT